MSQQNTCLDECIERLSLLVKIRKCFWIALLTAWFGAVAAMTVPRFELSSFEAYIVAIGAAFAISCVLGAILLIIPIFINEWVLSKTWKLRWLTRLKLPQLQTFPFDELLNVQLPSRLNNSRTNYAIRLYEELKTYFTMYYAYLSAQMLCAEMHSTTTLAKSYFQTVLQTELTALTTFESATFKNFTEYATANSEHWNYESFHKRLLLYMILPLTLILVAAAVAVLLYMIAADKLAVETLQQYDLRMLSDLQTKLQFSLTRYKLIIFSLFAIFVMYATLSTMIMRDVQKSASCSMNIVDVENLEQTSLVELFIRYLLSATHYALNAFLLVLLRSRYDWGLLFRRRTLNEMSTRVIFSKAAASYSKDYVNWLKERFKHKYDEQLDRLLELEQQLWFTR